MNHRIQAGPVEVVFDAAGHLLHLGNVLPDDGVPDYGPAIPHARIDLASWPSAIPNAADGWYGTPGIAVNGRYPRAIAEGLTYRDPIAGLEWSQHWRPMDDGVFCVHSEVRGHGQLDFLCSLSLPLQHCTDVGYLRGAWTREGQWQKAPLTSAGLHQSTRTGRSSAEGYPGVYLYYPDCVVIVALAWSGDWQWHCDWLPNGSRHFVIGESLVNGLALDGNHQTPAAIVAAGADESQARYRLHQAVRRHWIADHAPRGVHLNSWEAVYFDHRMSSLQPLIDAAPQAGVDRFVLDDGWFGSRRDDTSGLGDWTISDEVWPEGFSTLVQALDEHQLEFGLWVEPEMVNPDSNLYRAHPDWVLADSGYDAVTGRGQLQLNLGLVDVQEYLFNHLSALLSQYPIRYFKWDHNRLAHQPTLVTP